MESNTYTLKQSIQDNAEGMGVFINEITFEPFETLTVKAGWTRGGNLWVAYPDYLESLPPSCGKNLADIAITVANEESTGFGRGIYKLLSPKTVKRIQAEQTLNTARERYAKLNHLVGCEPFGSSVSIAARMVKDEYGIDIPYEDIRLTYELEGWVQPELKLYVLPTVLWAKGDTIRFTIKDITDVLYALHMFGKTLLGRKVNRWSGLAAEMDANPAFSGVMEKMDRLGVRLMIYRDV